MKNVAKMIGIAGAISLCVSACSPVQVSKCAKEIVYDQAGKAISEYNECVTQSPNSLPPIHLRHQELLQ
jgi:hypothetical protein